MKAMVFEAYGDPAVLHWAVLPDPVAGPDEIVVDVHVASVNGADAKVRRGGGIYSAAFLHVLGRDFSGTVRAIGANVTDWNPGDAVFGVLDQGIEGTYAEQLVTTAALVARKPDGIDHSQAAALALAGITEDFSAFAATCDVVFETVGAEVHRRSYAALPPGGKLVWIAPPPADFIPFRTDVIRERPPVLRDRAHLDRIATLLAEGAWTPPPVRCFSLGEAARAHHISEGRHLRGKLVLQP